ncbi:MAG TPA: zinc ribbon domain-containing protein [Candidatus Binatia bacterium]|jgi:hypothetical protein|nr:zinc ribbon domain-containing protein [Candidatus Binatia bacterium]
MKKCSYCGTLNDDALSICSECGTALPSERFEAKPPRVLTPIELRTRRGALRDGILWLVLSLGVLAIGWLYPAWFFGRDPIMRHDPDPRVGPAVLIGLATSFTFAVLAVRSFRHMGGSQSASASK